MIVLNWTTMTGQIGALMARYAELPRHIAKKHLQAAMKRSMKDGVPKLKALTPKGKTQIVKSALKRGSGGRFVAGSGKKMKVRGGALRRAVRTKAKYIGRNNDGVVYGTIGYKAGFDSQKAIWLEFGTKNNVRPRQIMDKFRRSYGGPAAKVLARQMKKALAAAVREMRSGRNPTRIYSPGGSWRAG